MPHERVDPDRGSHIRTLTGSVKHRLVLLIGIATVLFLGILFSWRKAEIDRADSFFRNVVREQQASVSQMLILDSRPLGIFASEYSRRADMARFIAEPKSPWGDKNLKAGLATYGADFVFAFDPSGRLVYANATEEGRPILEHSFQAELFGQLVRRGRVQYYEQTGHGLLEIHGATIQLSQASDAPGSQAGFVVVGRVVTSRALTALGQLTNCHLSLIRPSLSDLDVQQSDLVTGRVIALEPLSGLSGRTEMLLRSETTRPFLAMATESSNRATFIGVVFAVALLLALSLSITSWVTRFMQALIHFLRTGDHSSLARLERSRTEVGELARLIAEFFAQKQSLIAEMAQRRRIETELIAARDAAEAASRAKTQFLANMSHEVRTPMNGILGMTGLLLEQPADNLSKDYLQTIQGSANTLMGILDDILDLSKIESGSMKVEAAPFDLREIVYEVAEISAPSAESKGLELVCVVPPETPSQLVGDAARVRQVIASLLSNAVKFTDRGEVIVELTLLSRRDRRAAIRVSVRDTGVGIPLECQESIFESFSQVDSSATRRFGGSGLGLTLSRRLVEMMGASLVVESAPGSGSLFWFDLELPEAEAADDSLESYAGIRVALIEANGSCRRALAQHIAAWGATCRSFPSADAALTAFRNGRESCDLLILSGKLHDMDAVVAVETLRTVGMAVETPVVLLSPVTARLSPEAMRHARISCELVRPPQPTALNEAIAKALRRIAQNCASLAEPESRPLEGARVLIAEDNPTNQKLAVHLLTRWGCRVDIADDGIEALHAFDAGWFDLVLMDIQMPNLGGLEATARIRERESETGARRTPIIAMTANTMYGDREACLGAGMDDYVPKPVRSADLLEAIKRLLPGLGVATPEVKLAASPVFDAGVYEEIAGGDEAFGRELLAIFLESAEEHVNALLKSIETSDEDALLRAAHSLKGSSLSAGAISLGHLAAEIELAVRSKQPITPFLEQVAQRWRETQDTLGEVLRRAA